jgi:hypothetical protein
MNKPFGIGKAIAEAVSEEVKEKAKAKSAANIRQYLFASGPDTEPEDIEAGERLGVGETVRAAWAKAKAEEKEMQEAWLAHTEEKPSSFILPKVQPIRVESKVEVVKQIVEWRQTGKGWEYLLERETIYRRGFGPAPKHLEALALPKPKPEPEPEPEEEPKKAAVEGKLPAVIPPSPEPVAPEWNEAIAAMNNQHAIIENVGGKAVIASWEPSSHDLGRLVVVFQNKESFLLRYSNRFIPIEVHTVRGSTVVRAPLGQWWLAHRDRQQYRGVTFRPSGAKVVNGCLNLWQGWGVEAKPGDWSLIREHIENVIAGGNKEFGDYVICWNAWAVQHPDQQAEVALVLIGLKGVGKGTLVRCLVHAL